MNRRTITGLISSGALLGVCGVLSAGATLDFSRYQPILDRMPFGEVVLPAAPPAPATDPPPPPLSRSFARNLRLCGLKRSASGIRVAFLDVAGKNTKKSYFLYEGETSDDGIEVVKADFEEEKVLFRKDGNEYWVPMGQAVSASATPSAPPGRGSISRTSRSSRGTRTSHTSVRSSPSSAGSSSSASRSSYMERLRQRREALAKRNEQLLKNKLSGPALQKHLEEYNMALIREGKPALPIPLTTDQDQQLVKEGVLPPQ